MKIGEVTTKEETVRFYIEHGTIAIVCDPDDVERPGAVISIGSRDSFDRFMNLLREAGDKNWP